MEHAQYIYDVFIAYASADQEWAEAWLRPRLEQAGLQVCSDDTFDPGVPKLVNLERAIGNSRQTVLILTPAWVASEWSEFAGLLSQTVDPAARQRRLLPLVLQPCRVPSRLGILTSIDFTRPEQRDKELRRLVEVIQGELRLPERPLSREQRNRDRMLQKVRDFWIKGVLENSLHGAALIELGMQYRSDAVQHPWDMIIQESEQPPRSIAPNTKIIDIFDERGSELLILGAPGAGKTTVLLELARDLLRRAEQDEHDPMPVVFNLSSWAEKRASLAEWLVDELNTKYDVPRKIGTAWVDADQLLLLLDGLDEVRDNDRAACVQAINAFRADHGLVGLAVCSRVADYGALTTQLKLQDAVLIQPLTAQQIEEYLASFGAQLGALRATLAEDAAMRELAESPLMLSVMTLTYQGKADSAMPVGRSPETQREHLFASYVERMFARRGVETHYSQEQTIDWLVWLSGTMQSLGQTTLFLERMQPGWLQSRSSRVVYNLLDRLIGIVLACGLCAVLDLGRILMIIGRLTIASTRYNLVDLLQYIPAWGPIIGLNVGIFLSTFGGKARVLADEVPSRWTTFKRFFANMFAGSVIGSVLLPIDIAWFNLQTSSLSRVSIASTLFFVIFAVPIGAIVGGFTALFVGQFSWQPRDVMIVEKLRWSWPRALRSALRSIGIGVLGGVLSAASCTPIGLFLGNDVAAKLDGGARFFLLGLILGGGLGLGVGVLLGLFSLLFGGFTSDELPMKSVPNQGIRQSLRNGLRIGAGGGLLAFLLTYPVLFALSRYPSSSTFLYAVYAGLAVALLSGFGFGGYATISHFALRIVLWRNGSIPWNYARFLDHCAERIFLRKVGGGYIFIHRMLMEYFASLDTAWLEPNQRIE